MGRASEKIPATAAIRALRAGGVAFAPHTYRYIDHGGTKHAAESLGVPEHVVIKTLVMEATGNDGKRRPLLVLMHGDWEVSTKALARELGVKLIEPASPGNVERATGYKPGGVSPFGARTPLPVYVEASILALDKVLINGGKQGLLVEISPSDIRRLLQPTEVRAGLGNDL